MNSVNAQVRGSTEVAVLQRSELLTREEAAAYLGIAPQTLAMWKWAKRYDLPFVKIGRLCKYKRSDLDAFIQRHSTSERLDGQR